MEFCFVSPWNVFQEVLVYGAPKLAGKWKIVHKVLNPTAGHQFTLQVKVGKSTIESKTKGFKYSWETSDGVQLGILNLSASMSMKLMMEQTSSQTWSDETTTTYQITGMTTFYGLNYLAIYNS
ncbi:hypothetical protein DPMN_089096 [Dreissena polymorpha]|uniref:Uncharacterized protein n=1 Tax=Dreissena polymorpha TaxID=45954 RepID=A0A9D4KW46_DREPO|nr:hypothetical protein DPMN_089096 [Dreissena polymorpha]